MDPVRKLVSEGLQRQTPGPHPDPDLLSAFAEKALPERDRAQVLAHLAECGDCRQVVFFALPDSAETQKVLAIEDRPRSSFVLRWGTLTAAIVVCAVLLVATRHRGAVSTYKQVVRAKAPGQIAAELKTPPELAEMRALRDDRASTKTNVTRQAEVNKVIPTPKHMTAKPAGKFDFDQTGQVRMAPRSEAAQVDDLQVQGRNFVSLGKLDAGAAASPQSGPGAIGGLIQNKNAAAYSTTSGQGQGALAKVSLAAGNLGGTVLDASGAVIPNATVTTVGPIGTRAAQSDPQGRFSFDHLVPGTYSVKAQAPGFKTTDIEQVALLDKPLDLQLTLELGSTSEAVEVTAASPVETTSAEIAQNEKQSNQLSRKKSVPANYRGAMAKAVSVAMPQWTLSPDGIVQRSLDAGKSWQDVPVAGTSGFRALSSAGAHVWVGGSAGALYHSADSGQTWTRVAPVAAGRKLEADITHVDFADPMNGTVTTASGEAWSTSDGGQTWQVR